jgi:hypothetical protein
MYHVLVVKGLHHKNENAMAKYTNIKWTRVQNIDEWKDDLSIFDAVFCPGSMVDVSKYPHVKFIFGPHLAVLPNDSLHIIRGSNSIYIQPSQWVVDFWKLYPVCKDLTMKALPFGVDTDAFCPVINDPLVNKKNVFIYFKNRKPEELKLIVDYLNRVGVSFTIFSYKDGYNEKEYIDYLQTCKYGIWLDAHESQGFALEEALSCNVPLLVWNVISLNQAYGYSCPDFAATTVPYWDSRCGEFFHTFDRFESTYQLFLSKIDSYQPRDYIVENLSISLCENKFIELLNY